MTTPEHAWAPFEPGNGRHRKSLADNEIDAVVLTWNDNESAVRDAYERHGAPFAAFLRLDDTNPNDPDIENTFLNSYLASYDILRDAIDEQIDQLGWQDALTAMREEWGIAAGDLLWNYTAIEAQYREVFDVIEAYGRVHIFHR